MLKLAQQTDLLTGGRSDAVVRFCGFPPQGSETQVALTKEDSKNSTRKPQAVVHL